MSGYLWPAESELRSRIYFPWHLPDDVEDKVEIGGPLPHSPHATPTQTRGCSPTTFKTTDAVSQGGKVLRTFTTLFSETAVACIEPASCCRLTTFTCGLSASCTRQVRYCEMC